MRKDLGTGQQHARGAFGSPACRSGGPAGAYSPIHATPRSKQQHGTPSDAVRRTALQQSSAGNSPGVRTLLAARPASAHSVRPAGAHTGEVTESHIKVYVRTRPAVTIQGQSCVTADPEASTVCVQEQPDVKSTPRKKGRHDDHHGSVDSFVFEDGVLDPDISQADVFEKIGRPAAEAVLEGYNVTVFAYGQTGAGKTHSIYGKRDHEPAHPEAGLTDRIMTHLISSGIAEMKSAPGVSYRYAVSMLDIYDEKISDLFEPGHEKQVRLTQKGAVYVEGQNWQPVSEPLQASSTVRAGLQHRTVCCTAMNSESSRSHTICMFRVSRDETQEDGHVLNRSAIITIVDLCGSERIKKSEVEGARRKEAININSSLTALKTVIQAIGSRAKHVPFRDSILTWVLKDCIGGNSKVAIIAHINPCAAHAYESTSTLRFVSMVKTVKTRVTKNERFKSEEELAELAALEAEEALEQAHACAAAPAASAPETADTGTQVTPKKTKGKDVDAVLMHLSSDLLQLKSLFDQGVLEKEEYQHSKQRILDLWRPARPEDCAEQIPPQLLLHTLEHVHSPGTRDSVAVHTGDTGNTGAAHYADLENVHPNLSHCVAPRDRAIPMTIKGPAVDSECDIIVRESAPLLAVAQALEACNPDQGSLGLYYNGMALDLASSAASLSLPAHCVLDARTDPRTSPPDGNMQRS
eukprot:Tamp_07896.p1 GENE.Tamp_07896~~Tamp_07896.p1  ORF type:complete len:719 (-),score=91.44 Tamp_07896:262-2340(-)